MSPPPSVGTACAGGRGRWAECRWGLRFNKQWRCSGSWGVTNIMCVCDVGMAVKVCNIRELRIWSDDQKSGYATETYPDGGEYVGQWHQNLRNGHGVYSWADGRSGREQAGLSASDRFRTGFRPVSDRCQTGPSSPPCTVPVTVPLVLPHTQCMSPPPCTEVSCLMHSVLSDAESGQKFRKAVRKWYNVGTEAVR